MYESKSKPVVTNYDVSRDESCSLEDTTQEPRRRDILYADFDIEVDELLNAFSMHAELSKVDAVKLTPREEEELLNQMRH